MSKLLVSFDIHYDNETNYTRIYNALNDSIQKGRTSLQWWNETTSFYVVDAAESASAFIQRVTREAAMRKTSDRIVVFDAEMKAGATWGNIQDPAIYSLSPFLQKL